MKNRILALILSLAMVFSMLPVSALATDGGDDSTTNSAVNLDINGDGEVIYVSLGDSTTNGYGLTGYELSDEDYNWAREEAAKGMAQRLLGNSSLWQFAANFLAKTKNLNGLLVETPGAYPALFRDYLETVSGDDVNLIQLAISGARTENIYSVLTYGEENEYPFDGSDGNTYEPSQYKYLNALTKGREEFKLPFDWYFLYHNAGLAGDYRTARRESASKLFKNSIDYADIISVNLGSNNFSTYLHNYLENYMMGNSEDVIDTVDYQTKIAEFAANHPDYPNLGEKVEELYAAIKAELKIELTDKINDEKLEDVMDGLADRCVYTFLGYCVAYAGILEEINAINPDAKIILMSMVNFMDGFTIELDDGSLFDMSKMVGMALDASNDYAALIANELTKDEDFTNPIYYANVTEDVDYIMDRFPTMIENNFEGYEVLRERMITSLGWWVANLSPENNLYQVGEDVYPFQINAQAAALVQSYFEGEINEDYLRAVGAHMGLNDAALNAVVLNAAIYLGVERTAVHCGQLDSMKASAFAAMFEQDYNAQMQEVFAAMIEAVEAVAVEGTLEAYKQIPDLVKNSLLASDMAVGFFYFTTYFQMGDGVACHPSEIGYQTMYTTLVDAFENETAPSEVVDVRAWTTAKDILAFLDENNYVSAEKKADIVVYVANYLLAGSELTNQDILDIAEYVYGTLNADLTADAKIDVIGNVCAILEDAGYLNGYIKELNAVEDIYNYLADNNFISAQQASDIVDVVVAALFDDGEVAISEVKQIAMFIYRTLFAAPVTFRMMRSANAGLSVGDKIAIIEKVYEVLDDNGYLAEYTELDAVVEIYDDLSNNGHISDEKALEVFDIVFVGLMENDEVTDEIIAEIGDEVLDAVLNDPTVSDEAKGAIVDKIMEVLEKNGLGGVAGLPTMPPAVKEVYDYLDEKEYLDGAQKAAVLDYVYNVMTDDGEKDLAVIAEELYAILNPGLSVADKLDIVYFVYSVAEKYGYLEYEAGYISMAFTYAWQYAAAEGYLETVGEYLDVAIEVVAGAYQAIEALEVSEELVNTKALLLEELDNAGTTISVLMDLIADDELTADEWNTILNYQAELDKHVATIAELAAEMGVLGDLALTQIEDACEYVETLVNDIAADAYAWAVATDADFSTEYTEMVNEIVDAVSEINPALGAVVGEYLTETPAEAMKLIFAAGEDAVDEFVAVARVLAEDIETIIDALAVVLESNIDEIIAAIDANGKIDAIKAEIEVIKAEILSIETNPAPVSPYALRSVAPADYDLTLEQLKAQLAAKQKELVEEIIATVYAVDPYVGASVEAAWNALVDIANQTGAAGAVYAEWFADRFELLAGDLLALIIENTKTYGLMAGQIVDEMIWDLIEGIAIEIEEEVDEVLGQIEFSVDLSEVKALIAELEATAAEIRTQIAAAKAYTGELLDAEIETLEAALYAIETYAAELNAFVTNVETLVNGIDLTEMTIDSVKKLVAQAQVLAADAETLVDDAKASFAILTAIYEKVMPKVIELAAYVEEGSPMDIALDTADNKIGAFIAVSESGYNTTVAELETAAANIEIIVTETLGVVSEAVAVALDELTVATETAADDIFAAAEDAIAVIKAEAIALANSTDAEIAAAGQEILALVENFEITVSEAEFEAKHAEVMALVDSVITAVQAVDSIEDAEAILTQATEALEALHTIAKDVYAIAEGDVITVLGEAETLAEIAKAVVESAASTIGANAVAAYEVSADAICTAVDTSIEAVNTAIAAYETAIVNAMNIIVPAVTEAVEEITVEVTGVAETAVKAVEASIERAEECEAIIDALENVVYDATHGEIVGDCAGKIDTVTLVGTTVTENIKDADLITVKFDDGEFMTFIYNQVMGLVAEVINSEPKLVNLLNGQAGAEIEAMLGEYGIDRTAAYTELDWSVFGADVIAARDEILVIVENLLVAQGVPAVYSLDIGTMIQPILDEQFGAGLVKVDLILQIPVVDLLVEVAENSLYGYFEFATEFPATLNTIRETAPNAHVAVIGISNNVASVLPAIVTDNIDISEYNEYIDYVVDALNLHLFTYAAINTNTTFVEDGNVADAIEIKAGEHVYDEPEFSWVGTTLTGTLTCGVCADGTPGKVLTDSADGVVKSSTAGDCTTLGTTTYEATVTLNGQDYTKEITIEGAYGPHTYGEPEFSWEGTTLTGTLTCNKCENNTPGKVLTDSADGVVKSSTAGNCTTLGTTTYEATVTLNGQDYTKEITIDGTYGPHNYGVWFSNGSSGHKRVCANDSTHVETEAHDYGSDRVCDICSYVKPSGGGGAGGGGGIVYDKGCPRDKTCPMYGYTDLNMTSWYHDAVHYCIEKGLMIGTGKNIFEPNIALTRAMMVQILYNLEGRPVYTVESNFSDVFDGAWYEDCIHWAAQQGFVNGYPEGDFRPNQYVSRQEMATMLWRYAGSKETSHDLSSYTDADTISGYARTAMAWANENGIINGMTDNTLAPTGDATRAQIAQLMMNYLAK